MSRPAQPAGPRTSNTRPSTVIVHENAPVRVLVCGIDTLHLFFTAPLDTDLLEAISAARESAKTSVEGEPPPEFEIGGHTFAVQAHGAGNAPYLLTSEFFALKLNPKPAGNFPTAMLELRAIYLWQRGPIAAVDDARALLRVVANTDAAEELLEPKVTRVDLAVDFQGWVPKPSDLARVVARAASDDSHRIRRGFTGFSFGGGGNIVARLYDKTAEIKKSGKGWFLEIWKESDDFDPKLAVWRIEFQLRRAALRTIRLGKKPDGKRLDTWTDVRDGLAALWQYLSRYWLSFREPRKAKTRQCFTPAWETLVTEPFTKTWSGTETNLYRRFREDSAQRDSSAFGGYLARLVAEHDYLTGKNENVMDAAPYVVMTAMRQADRAGRSLDTKKDEKLARWRESERATSKIRDDRTETIEETRARSDKRSWEIARYDLAQRNGETAGAALAARGTKARALGTCPMCGGHESDHERETSGKTVCAGGAQ